MPSSNIGLVENTRTSTTATTKLGDDRIRDFAEIGADWYWETDRDHRFTFMFPGYRRFGQEPNTRIGCVRTELASGAERDSPDYVSVIIADSLSAA